MTFTTPDLVPALPEIVLLGAACAILVVDLLLRDGQRGVVYLLTHVTLLVCAVITVGGV